MMRSFRKFFIIIMCALFLPWFVFGLDTQHEITVGSKKFPESYILAEIMAQLLEENGFKVNRNLGLGGTAIAYEALKNGDIQVYPEYTGTAAINLLKLESKATFTEINSELNKTGLSLLSPFGFNNTYALMTRAVLAKEKGWKRISDLLEE